MKSAQMEAWSTGSIKIHVEGGAYLPIIAAVELLRVSSLVQVIARADAEDPAFRSGFPLVMATVEPYPEVSLAVDPLVELGKKIAQAFFDQVTEHVQKQLRSPRSVLPPS